MESVSSTGPSNSGFEWAGATPPGGNDAETEAACRRLQADAPQDLKVLLLLGSALFKTGKFEESASWLRRAVELQPQSIGALSRLGSAYVALQDYARAKDCFNRCVRLNPGCAAAYYHLGNTCLALGDDEQAIVHYQEALKLEPRNHEVWKKLGNAFRELNQLDRALAAYDRSLAILPTYESAHGARAVTLLSAGRLEEGFREYEWRWGRNGRIDPSRPYPQPVWNGETLPQKTLFIHAEQGYGDMIQFVRFVGDARRRVPQVILECQAPLKSLFANSGSADLVISAEETPPPFDMYIPIMSLPRVLGTALTTVPADIPYLAAPPDRDLPPVPMKHLKAGLVWAGNPKHHDDAWRSIRLEELAPILRCQGVSFFSLQVAIPPRDQACLASFPNLINLGGRLEDFRSTASVIQRMDLVITVDTAVAHLAGALGKPTWTFIQHAPDWRWLLERPDTPWYPTMRLFRQEQKGKWESAISLVVTELNRLPQIQEPRFRLC